jgi:uncharacterized membrane protein YkgB
MQPTVRSRLDRLDALVIAWMARHAVACARVSLGVVFLWFGGLKLFPGLSPAEGLAGKTLLAMSGGLVEPWLSVPVLGAWEALMGLGLLTGVALRATLLSLLLHMAGTVTPAFLFPADVFARPPLGLTFEGQYIVKNVVLVGAAIVIGATVRGGSLRSEA